MALIGPSIAIKGEVSGEEDLEIQGRLEGSVSMKKHRVTVGQSGRVKADIHAKSIQIAGEVEGNLFGDEEVILRQSGRVLGNITAARVTLENGSKFKGSIDMEPKTESKRSEAAVSGKTGNGAETRDAKQGARPLVGESSSSRA